MRAWVHLLAGGSGQGSCGHRRQELGRRGGAGGGAGADLEREQVGRPSWSEPEAGELADRAAPGRPARAFEGAFAGPGAGPDPGELPADPGLAHDLHEPGAAAGGVLGQSGRQVLGPVLDLPRVRWSVGEGRSSVVPGQPACATGSHAAARFLVDEQNFGTAARNNAGPLGLVNSGRGDMLGVVRDLWSPRPLRGLELGPLDPGSQEPVTQAAAPAGCAVAFLAWGWLARGGLGR